MQSETFQGEIGLACGHTWQGGCSTQAEAEAFLAACVATGDTVLCRACNARSAITGPLTPRRGMACGSCFLGECSEHAGAEQTAGEVNDEHS